MLRTMGILDSNPSPDAGRWSLVVAEKQAVSKKLGQATSRAGPSCMFVTKKVDEG